jgi:Fic family protein
VTGEIAARSNRNLLRIPKRKLPPKHEMASGNTMLRLLQSTPIHLAAYLMWRLNWIHPFADGNGRTSRIISYVVLSIRAGAILPGTPTIPDQIVDNRKPYFDALDAADLASVVATSTFRKWKSCWALSSQISLLSSTNLSAENCLDEKAACKAIRRNRNPPICR